MVKLWGSQKLDTDFLWWRGAVGAPNSRVVQGPTTSLSKSKPMGNQEKSFFPKHIPGKGLYPECVKNSYYNLVIRRQKKNPNKNG